MAAQAAALPATATSPCRDHDSGERARLADLYRRLRPAVFARCRLILADPAAAEDATQETFLRVHCHQGRTPAGADVRPWILRIASNVCLSEIRSHRRRLRRQALQADPQTLEPPARCHEQMALVEQTLLDAPATVQQVVRLCCFDGLEQHVVATRLGVSTRTVAARLAHFRRCLRRVFLQQEPRNAQSGNSSR